MTLFGLQLSDVESILLSNVRKTKSVFPDETQLIEFGLTLMTKLTQISKDAIRDYWNNPNLVANHNLFARNRQLLLNAYICGLNSSYGTQFIILRTVLENNNLMRYFNKHPQHAFEWFSQEMQQRFAKDVKARYGSSKESNQTFNPRTVTESVFSIRKGRVKKEIEEFYGQLCNYTHPNFLGWQELVGKRGETEIIQNMPQFSPNNSDKSIGMMLYLMQLSFKTFVDTFREYLSEFARDLNLWQNNYNRLIPRYIEGN